MGGGSKKTGGVSAPEVTSNPREAGNSSLWQNEQGISNLTSFEQSLINPQVSQANWATDIATGGNSQSFSPWTTQNSPYGFGPTDPNHSYAGYGSTGQVNLPFSSSYPGQSGTPGSQSATPGAQSAYNTQGGIEEANYSGILGPYLGAQANALNSEGYTADLEGQAASMAPAGLFGNAITAGTGNSVTAGLDGNAVTAGLNNPVTAGLAGNAVTAGNNLDPTTGLYADQQALIDAQVQSGQAALNQQLGSEGLTSSTQGAELNSEIGLQGAATGGQLIQQNIALAQNAQQQSAADQAAAQEANTQFAQTAQQQSVADQAAAQEANTTFQQNAQSLNTQYSQSAQQLQEAGLTATYGMFSGLATQDSQQQAQMWQEAMQGQGQLGAYLNNILSTYGMDMQGAQISEQGNAANSQVQEAASAASAGGGSSGGGSSGLGSLIGSVGGLFASSAGGTSAISGIGTALAGLFA
jgi:hypothetical protein